MWVRLHSWQFIFNFKISFITFLTDMKSFLSRLNNFFFCTQICSEGTFKECEGESLPTLAYSVTAMILATITGIQYKLTVMVFALHCNLPKNIKHSFSMMMQSNLYHSTTTIHCNTLLDSQNICYKNLQKVSNATYSCFSWHDLNYLFNKMLN